MISAAPVLFLGAGDLALAAACMLSAQPQRSFVLARRNPRTALFPDHWRALDFADQAALFGLISELEPSHVVLSGTPDLRDEVSYRRCYLEPVQSLSQARKAGQIKDFRLIFASSTAVYGEDQGHWVDEQTMADSENFNGKILRQAELALSDSDLSLRFSGLYRPALRDQGAADFFASLQQRAVPHPRLLTQPSNHFSNRVHLFDAAAALIHVGLGSALEGVINVSDRHPSTGAELSAGLTQAAHAAQAAQAKLPAPDGIDTGQRVSGQRVSGKRVSGKRVSVKRLSETGFHWRYPSFRDGYHQVDVWK